jgi:hypothetical protein
MTVYFLSLIVVANEQRKQFRFARVGRSVFGIYVYDKFMKNACT